VEGLEPNEALEVAGMTRGPVFVMSNGREDGRQMDVIPVRTNALAEKKIKC
jgi:hypothetical protein